MTVFPWLHTSEGCDWLLMYMQTSKMASLSEVNKSSRSANLTAEEKERVIELGLKYRHILENKRTDATNAQLKEAAWKTIASEFNATASSARSHQQLKQVGYCSVIS